MLGHELPLPPRRVSKGKSRQHPIRSGAIQANTLEPVTIPVPLLPMRFERLRPSTQPHHLNMHGRRSRDLHGCTRFHQRRTSPRSRGRLSRWPPAPRGPRHPAAPGERRRNHSHHDVHGPFHDDHHLVADPHALLNQQSPVDEHQPAVGHHAVQLDPTPDVLFRARLVDRHRLAARLLDQWLLVREALINQHCTLELCYFLSGIFLRILP